MTALTEKQEIRKLCRKNRSALSADEVRVKSNEICQHLMNYPKVQQAGQVLVYSAIHKEVDLRKLVEWLWEAGKSVAFPKVLDAGNQHDEASGESLVNADMASFQAEKLPVADTKSNEFNNLKYLSTKLIKDESADDISYNDMEFYEITCWNQLESGAFGILEPQEGLAPIIPQKDAVICVPGVAFSPDGSRIGMGRGYYDRYLSRYPYIYKIGVAYEVQMEYNWEADDLDVSMDTVVTELESRP